jgi:hypothetical protein
MMQGFVNQNCEAMLPIVIGRDNKPTQMVEALDLLRKYHEIVCSKDKLSS